MVGLISFLGSGVEVYSLNNGHTTRPTLSCTHSLSHDLKHMDAPEFIAWWEGWGLNQKNR